MRLRSHSTVLVAALWTLAATGTFAAERTWVPTQYPTIQDAITAASDGDIIAVLPGIYHENINFQGKAIKLVSTDGPEVTVIEGLEYGGSVVTFVSNERRGSILEGFTIQGGRGTYVGGSRKGGGIFMLDAGPVIRNNILVENFVTSIFGNADGGAIYCESTPTDLGCLAAPPRIEGNIIRTNQAIDGRGGAIYLQDCGAEIEGNVIENNTALFGGGIWAQGSSPQIIDNRIAANRASLGIPAHDPATTPFAIGWGGGIGIKNGVDPILLRNRVMHNIAGEAGGGIYLEYAHAVVENNLVALNETTGRFSKGAGIWTLGTFVVKGCTIANNRCVGSASFAGGLFASTEQHGGWVENSIIWGNRAAISAGLEDVFGDVTVRYSDVQHEDYRHPRVEVVSHESLDGGNPGPRTNIHRDPRFVDPDSSDFRLRVDSPCLDAGNPADLSTGLDLDGFPRVLDGHLDRVMAPDMGAFEYCNVSLAVTGDARPGGSLMVELDGTPSLALVLFVGFEEGDVLLPPYGPLYMDPTAMMFRVVGILPVSLEFQIPEIVPTPLPLVLQGLAMNVFSQGGNFSNAEVVWIRRF